MKDINKDLENNFNNAEKLNTGDYDGAIKLLLNILEKKKIFCCFTVLQIVIFN